MTTPVQIAELTHRLKHETWSGFQNLAVQASTAITEQATEIAALKAHVAGAEAEIAALKQGLHRADEKLAEVMPLAKFAAWHLTLTVIEPDDVNELDQNIYNKVIDAVLFEQDKKLEYQPNIEATITELLKD
jgi:hypothetical protein